MARDPDRFSVPPLHKEGGAAMVEFLVIATFVLVPMYLAVQALGKFADVRSAAVSAARYSAWERTVWFDDASSDFARHNAPNQKSTAAIANEVRVRVLNKRDDAQAYKSTDKAATTLANGTDPLWTDTAGKAYLTDPANVVTQIKQETPAKDFLAKVIGTINAISVPSVTGTLAPPVPSQTMAVATVNLNKVAEDSDVYKRLWAKSEGLPDDWTGLNFTAQGAILSNTWAANASEGTRKVVASSVPTANGLGTAVETATRAVLLAWDPLQVPRIDLGKIAVDVVPPDRLR